ncbi:30S ribosomal protein S11 [Candidatus Kaiserbacteria bacterium CG_4_8_14_3_um_filter_38_9]|uniref:Small ribosomal subunit protein uS11 n=1 Tax=Candidatus Kaiserbacteria bacterium CG_4_8_14_3_um_filter_38_9 TaxID=1974599 RepID=A0A2M7IPG1_9BACT|nr:30S ribosomal protein S11 [Candidatus Kaiserbacteria bacterium]PIW97165.1 MAG: 30S ribosomal protein S11 [Candidatus Kaiserbacteria bacterium CG_4_8_14_3_um_filter_38_9]
MGKKRITKKSGGSDVAGSSRALNRIPKRKVVTGKLNIMATFNNTLLTLCDNNGNAVMSASSGALGFKGSRKSTPFAAAKVGEIIGEKAQQMGMKDAEIIVRGVGAGRESALRAFSGKGIGIIRIVDMTPVPFNGVRAPKPRRI